MTDAALRAAAERASGRTVRRLRRRPARSASSFALEEIEVVCADGHVEHLIAKDLSPERLSAAGSAAKPAQLLDPAREVEAYRDVLGPWGADVPALRAWSSDDATGEHWLLLEAVDGVPLWQAEGLEPWDAAARWLAELHGHAPPGAPRHLVRYDTGQLGAWLDRATARVPAGALDPVAAVWDDALARMAAWPLAFVHGDFYAANVLVDGAGPAPRIRPVDWELAGIGPGLLDLAALTAGRWSAGERERFARAYAGAWIAPTGGPARDAVPRALEDARLLVAVQWLGWSDAWSPPVEHAHDWLADALDAAERLR